MKIRPQSALGVMKKASADAEKARREFRAQLLAIRDHLARIESRLGKTERPNMSVTEAIASIIGE